MTRMIIDDDMNFKLNVTRSASGSTSGLLAAHWQPAARAACSESVTPRSGDYRRDYEPEYTVICPGPPGLGPGPGVNHDRAAMARLTEAVVAQPASSSGPGN